MDRAAFVRLGARNGAAVAAVTVGAAALAGTTHAAASGPVTDLDLALARLAVAAEVLSVEFYTEAIAARRFAGRAEKALRRALFNEQEHLTALSQLLTGAGQTPATADDFDIAFPEGTFASRGAIAKFGVVLETMSVGAYLGAVDSFGQSDLKTTAARIAASEAQHQSLFSDLAANRPVGLSFPEPIGLETMSDFLDAYLS